MLSHVSLCDPMDRSPPDSSVPGILQVRILEWVPMPSSRGSSPPRDQTQDSPRKTRATGPPSLQNFNELSEART